LATITVYTIGTASWTASTVTGSPTITSAGTSVDTTIFPALVVAAGVAGITIGQGNETYFPPAAAGGGTTFDS
jgi:hypothetical protein